MVSRNIFEDLFVLEMTNNHLGRLDRGVCQISSRKDRKLFESKNAQSLPGGVLFASFARAPGPRYESATKGHQSADAHSGR